MDFLGVDLTSGDLLYTVFLPFILIFTLLFGALEVLYVFNKKINLVLALVFTLFSTQTPAFAWFATVLPLYGATAAVGVFATLFVVLTGVFFYKRMRDTWFRFGPPEDRLRKINEKIEKLNEQFRRTGNETKRRALDQTLKELEKERDYLKRLIAR
jgi:hypothetical protein